MLKKNNNQDNSSGTSTAAAAGSNVEQALRSYIMHTLLPPDSGIELNVDDDLLSIDCLDSMQFMRLVQFTEETYQLKIPAEDMLIENFQTVERLAQYLSERFAS